jgi:chloride channel 3/4/5
MTVTERTSLLDRRRSSRQPQQYTEDNTVPLSLPLPSPFREPQDPITFSPSNINKNHRFKWFNKRNGSYDEDRQGLVKESTGVRVWSESYSSIGMYNRNIDMFSFAHLIHRNRLDS